MMLGYDHVVVAGASMIIGVAGREMFNWVADKVFHRKNGNGNGLANATRRDVQDVFESTIKAEVLPELRVQTEILKGVAETNKSMSENIVKLVAIEEAPRRRR